MGGRSVCGAIIEEGGGGLVGEVAVGGEVEVQDEVFVDAEDDSGVGGDGEITGMDVPIIGGGNGGESAESVVEVPGEIGASGGICSMDVVEEKGEKSKDSIGGMGREGGDDIVESNTIVSGGDISANLEDEGEVDVLGGGVSGNNNGGNSVDASVREEGAVGGVPGANNSEDVVEPIPLMAGWRLRDILAHAEGECV